MALAGAAIAGRSLRSCWSTLIASGYWRSRDVSLGDQPAGGWGRTLRTGSRGRGEFPGDVEGFAGGWSWIVAFSAAGHRHRHRAEHVPRRVGQVEISVSPGRCHPGQPQRVPRPGPGSLSRTAAADGADQQPPPRREIDSGPPRTGVRGHQPTGMQALGSRATLPWRISPQHRSSTTDIAISESSASLIARSNACSAVWNCQVCSISAPVTCRIWARSTRARAWVPLTDPATRASASRSNAGSTDPQLSEVGWPAAAATLPRKVELTPSRVGSSGRSAGSVTPSSALRTGCHATQAFAGRVPARRPARYQNRWWRRQARRRSYGRFPGGCRRSRACSSLRISEVDTPAARASSLCVRPRRLRTDWMRWPRLVSSGTVASWPVGGGLPRIRALGAAGLCVPVPHRVCEGTPLRRPGCCRYARLRSGPPVVPGEWASC